VGGVVSATTFDDTTAPLVSVATAVRIVALRFTLPRFTVNHSVMPGPDERLTLA
jgi:hypothetical protein